MANVLKKCPFCGGAAFMVASTVQCEKCGVEMQAVNKVIAESKWNNRPTEWINVKDRLPEIGEEVIVYTPNGWSDVTALCRLIRYEGATEFYWDNHYGGSNFHLQEAVTHWMPLPALQQEVQP